MNTQPDVWPAFYPAYHSQKGWQVEKLNAEIILRENLAAKWNERLRELTGTPQFYPLFDRIQANYAALCRLYDERYTICRKGVLEG